MPAVSQRPEFYRRIDDALRRKNKLVSAIEALAAESPSNRYPPAVEGLLISLRGSPTAEEFVQEGWKAAWLPLILRGVSADGSTSDNAEDLNQIAKELSNSIEVKASRWRMFAYPLVILASSIFLFVLLALTVIPTFQKMFREFELRLPPVTKLVLALSDLINRKPLIFCLSLVAIALIAIAAVRLIAKVFQWLETSWLLGFFLSGGTGSVKAMGRFTATLAELLNIGAPLEQAITIAGLASQNLRFRIASDRLAVDIGLSGRFCHKSAAAHNFPKLVSYALEAGADGGPSIGLLREVSTHYVDRAHARFNWWSGLLAPLTLVCVGLGVGVVVLSMFIPLFQLITSLS